MDAKIKTTGQLDFFEQNDAKVNKRMTKILLWMTLVFPAIFGLTAAGVFWIKYPDLIRMSIIGVFFTIGPFVLQKIGTPVKAMKYISVIAVGILVCMLGMNSSVGIYMTFGIMQLFSLMYFDKKFTIQISVIAYILMAVSNWFRVKDAIANGNAAPNLTYFPYMMGFTIEAVLMACVFISVAGISRKLLENLHSSEQVNAVMEKCGSVSEGLVAMMNNLADDVKESARATDEIVRSANETLENCAEGMKHVEAMQDTINEMSDAVKLIDGSTDEMLTISDEICARTDDYVEQMNRAVDSMHEIEAAANTTENSILDLEKVIARIESFVGEIIKIAEQTNILAINASIESSRAGEYGKGFSVVAQEIRTLAEHSKKSSNSVTETVNNVLKMLADVKKANSRNLNSVDAGISQISAAKDAAEKLGRLQEDSREKTKLIAESGKQTGERGGRVHEMARQMAQIVQISYEKANDIVEETDNQKRVTAATSTNFDKVSATAGELLELSSFGNKAAV